MRAITTMISLAVATAAFATVPTGYYDGAANKSGETLLAALYDKIGDHVTISYSGLWELYRTSDVHDNGKIWDMYSTKEWTYKTEQCGTYSAIGDCYNREHSFPKSWFSDASPMVSDAFHIYPTDGKVNGQRSNYPYGECANGTYVASNGSVRPLGRLGASTFSGYSGTVFEPDDEYKGDFARSYFYMAAAYYDRIADWESDMLAGNDYPAFSTWALNLLLKWHRQDPVSQKELDRNEVVYVNQGNRNPFIDYPDLVEHIWGTKTGEAWDPNADADPEIALPVDGTTVDFGVSALGHALEQTITVRTINATSNVTVAVSGASFATTTTTLSSSATNATDGAELTVTFTPTAVGDATGTLTLTCGTLSATVTLSGSCVDGLPAGPAEYVTSESFVATWVYIGDDDSGKYTLDVYGANGSAVDGYPCSVTAADGEYTVTGLDASTEYVYTVASRTMVSEEVYVTTGEPIPSIEFLFDGTLYFTTAPGEPSEPAEILINANNIDSDITVTVGDPFQLSIDRTSWASSVAVSPDQGRLYLRLYSMDAGTFSAQMVATAGTYTSDAVTVEGTATDNSDFLEDFEADATGFSTYTPSGNYQGTACLWTFSDVGIWDTDVAYSGEQSARYGKTGDSYIEMAKDRTAGIGTVSFYAKYWGSESDPIVDIMVSTDGGTTYTTAGTVTITSSDYQPYSVFVGKAGSARLRFQQTYGKRLNIDDIAITGYSSGLAEPEAERHAWDAYAADAAVTVAVTRTCVIGVYALDGTVLYYGILDPGTYSYAATPGLYIIVSDTFARRVIVK